MNKNFPLCRLVDHILGELCHDLVDRDLLDHYSFLLNGFHLLHMLDHLYSLLDHILDVDWLLYNPFDRLLDDLFDGH